jgi:hypothetical protein
VWVYHVLFDVIKSEKRVAKSTIELQCYATGDSNSVRLCCLFLVAICGGLLSLQHAIDFGNFSGCTISSMI